MRKEFEDKRAAQKKEVLNEAHHLAARLTKKALKTSKKEVKASLDKHRLGWVIDGKES